MWLNACMPEVTEVRVRSSDELSDEEVERDDNGVVIFRQDRRSPVTPLVVTALLNKLLNFHELKKISATCVFCNAMIFLVIKC